MKANGKDFVGEELKDRNREADIGRYEPAQKKKKRTENDEGRR